MLASGDPEDVRKDGLVGVGLSAELGLALALALGHHERAGVAFEGVREQARDDMHQVIDAGAGLGAAEADGDEVGVAQGGLEGVVDLLLVEVLVVAVLEVLGHEIVLHLDDLFDDSLVALFLAAEERIALALFVKDLDDAGTVGCREVHGEAFGAELFLELGHEGFEVGG